MPWWRDMRVWVHVALTAIMAGLSVALMMPGDTMGNPNWFAFAQVANETQWSFAFAAAAWVGALGLTSPRPWVVRVSTVALSMSHLTVALLFYRSAVAIGIANTGVNTYACIAALGFALAMIRCTE